MKNILKYTLLLLLPVIAMAGENGGYAGSFLRMGVGARATSMGNTGVAHPANAYSTFYNPAAFGLVNEHMVGLSYSFLSLDRNFEFVSFSMKVPPGAGFSIGWVRTSVGDLKSYNSIGEETGDINQSANAVYFSFGRKFTDRLSVGISLKILFEFINDGTEEFDYSANGVGVDLGMLYKVTDELSLGAQVKDIKSKFKANTDKIFERGGTTIDKFPLTYKVGAFYQTPVDWLRAAWDFEWSDTGHTQNHIGLEAVHGKNLALRAGLNGANLVFGAGMDFLIIKTLSFLDYSFVPSIVDEGSSHIFSWQIVF